MQSVKHAVHGVLALACVAGFNLNVNAQGLMADTPNTRPQAGYGFAPTVGTLLQADADKALSAALGVPAQAEPLKTATPARPATRLELLGIYGRSGSWRADVAIDGVVVPFDSGESYRGWTAQGVDNRCVSLAQQGHARKLCVTR